ncbi:hypothetical protein MMC07_003984 [Pseudocyphellaria aurata]|nr:hypothetical protein [Pseudocyphellaria aurata]
MADTLSVSFLGALQASVAVLLTMSYGVIAAQFQMLKGNSMKQLSTICVRMLLPALLLTNVGSQLHSETAYRYVPILIWSLVYVLTSMLLGFVATRLLKLPAWTTPAVCFNNTTALPLLLIQSLHTTGVLDKLLMSDTDTTSAALRRAKSYFLVCSVVGNCLTFAVGPKLLDGEESPDDDQEEDKSSPESDESIGHSTQDAEQGNMSDFSPQNDHAGSNNEDAEANEQTSLLPDIVIRHGREAGRVGYSVGKRQWDHLPPWAQSFLDFCYAFFNAPLIGAVVGAIIGLTPPLHRAFFNEAQEGGIFKAWLTDSLLNIGELFASLQVVVVGVKLSSSLRKMKRGEKSGNVPWVPMVFSLTIRFVIWPV